MTSPHETRFQRGQRPAARGHPPVVSAGGIGRQLLRAGGQQHAHVVPHRPQHGRRDQASPPLPGPAKASTGVPGAIRAATAGRSRARQRHQLPAGSQRLAPASRIRETG